MNESYQNDAKAQALYTPMGKAQLIQVAIFGLIAGLVVWGLTYVLEAYVLKTLLCQAADAVDCTQATQFAEGIAAVIVGAIGLFVLVKAQVFRPLLVIIAVLVSLWGLYALVRDLEWYYVALSMAGLYMICYLLFTWITRLRLFWLVLVLLIILITAIKLILNL